MQDHFRDHAHEYDARPVPQQISAGVFAAVSEALALSPDQTVMDFGAGTGLLTGKVAARVQRVLAVDVSPAMLDKLMDKPELQHNVEAICRDILHEPLDRSVDVIVSTMAAHHVEDTRRLFETLFAHLVPGGRLALADLDLEDGTFHPPEITGVFHAGFERAALEKMALDAGFVDVAFATACEVERDGRAYPIFLLTATKPEA